MIISLIVAMDEKGGIGKNNYLPWHLPSDLKRFKQITMGHPIIMGRQTYEAIGRPLAGRKMIVLTRNKNYHPNGCTIAYSINQAIEQAKEYDENEVFIIGGEDVFEEAIRIANRIYLTIVHANVDVDTYFPKIDNSIWKTLKNEGTTHREDDEFPSEFIIMVRLEN